MPVQLITYDLSEPGQQYSELHEEIESLGSTWWHCLESTWIVVTNLNTAQIRDRITKHLDQNDKVAVFSLEGEWAAWNLTQECSDWLQTNL